MRIKVVCPDCGTVISNDEGKLIVPSHSDWRNLKTCPGCGKEAKQDPHEAIIEKQLAKIHS